ncbi:unnamed protein product [Caenorhabditis nigoni]
MPGVHLNTVLMQLLLRICAFRESDRTFQTLAYDTAFHVQNLVFVISNDAGIMGVPFELSVDGIEMHFATNVFGHYVVVERLLPLLLKTNRPDFKSRVIVVSSGLYRNAETIPQVSKLLGQKTYEYSSKQAYTFSKLANCLYTVALANKPVHLHQAP